MLYLLFGLIWPLVYATCLMGVGAIAVSNDPVVLQFVAYSAAVMLPLRGIYYMLISLIKGNGVTRGLLIQTGAEITLAAGIVLLPNVSYGAFVVVFEIFLTFYIAVKLTDTIIYGKNHVFRFMIPSLVQAALFLHIFLTILLLPGEMRRRTVEMGTGIVLTLLGVAHVCDFLTMVVRQRKARDILGYIRVTMPGFIALTIPHRLMHAIKNAKIRKNSEDVNVEVFFQYGKAGIEVAGHCEICLDGRTYTYGNYDPESRVLIGTVGRGIIVRAQREEYIDWCVNSRNKMMMVYGLHLNESEMEQLRRRVEAFDSCLLAWDDEARALPEREYARMLCENVDAHAYQIVNGRFKTYFIPTINCVKLVDHFLGDTSIGHMVIPGIYSPGAYMDVLQRLYDTGSETVVSLKTYGLK